MNAHIEHDWASRTVKVWLYSDVMGGVNVLRFDDTGPIHVIVPQGEDPPPSLVLPFGALEALMAEAEKIIPASHATERHLQREIATSDRLLALVESRWQEG